MRCFIALGGNQGDVRATFRAAWDRLARVPGIAAGALSRVYRTPAVGDDAGTDFLNAAGELESTLEPLALLDALQASEAALGRMRTIHWGPRTLDLDLILYGDAVLDGPRLRVPHPACWYRRFVLDPLAELVPDVVHPVHRITLAALRERLLPRPLPVSLFGEGAWAAASIAKAFPQVRLVDLAATSDVGLRIAVPQETEPIADAAALTVVVPPGEPEAVIIFVRHVLDSALGEPAPEA